MASWGVCVLSSNPVDQVLAFVAHHLGLGAARIYVFLDRPDDPAADILEKLPGVVITRCTLQFWQKLVGERPEKHQERQRAVVRQTYAESGLDWLLHIDIDEFVVPQPVAVSLLLDEVPAWQQTVRMASLEALPGDLPKAGRIYRSVHFRGVVEKDDLRIKLFGPFASSLSNGILSHRMGKSFFRSGVPGMVPDIHVALFGKIKTESQAFHPMLQMLHFHADDAEEWVNHAHRRAQTGAYRFQSALKRTLLALDTAGLKRFHRRVHANDPASLGLLAKAGLLLNVDLRLEEKVNALPLDYKVAEPVAADHDARRGFFSALFSRRKAA